MTVNRSDLTNELAGVCGLTDEDATNGLDAILATITTSAAAGEKVIITGFGTFEMKTRKAREGRNMRTGETIHIPERTALTFKPSKPKA